MMDTNKGITNVAVLKQWIFINEVKYFEINP
jgi:hypothetical protein